jgi:hypothetical protein
MTAVAAAVTAAAQANLNLRVFRVFKVISSCTFLLRIPMRSM